MLVGITRLEGRTMRRLILRYIYEEVEGKGVIHHVVTSATQKEQNTVIVTELLYQLLHINYLTLQISKDVACTHETLH